MTPPYEGFVVPEELDFVVGLKEESVHCEMVERAAVQIDLMVYRPHHRLNLHLRRAL